MLPLMCECCIYIYDRTFSQKWVSYNSLSWFQPVIFPPQATNPDDFGHRKEKKNTKALKLVIQIQPS